MNSLQPTTGKWLRFPTSYLADLIARYGLDAVEQSLQDIKGDKKWAEIIQHRRRLEAKK